MTVPLPDTVPRTGMPPEPVMLLPRTSTPKLELGSQAPRCVMICTVQLPSNDVLAHALSAAALVIATVAAIQTVRSEIRFMVGAFGNGNLNLTRHSRSCSPEERARW